jgi:trimethylamine--corrinoid protein Co-methyltransferase
MAVIGNEIAGVLRRVQRGIEVNAETLATGVIQELAHKGDYLVHPHTLAHFKKEYYYPRLFNRHPRPKWISLGSPAILDDAEARVEKLRALPARSAVSAAQRRELLAIEKKWTAALA